MGGLSGGVSAGERARLGEGSKRRFRRIGGRPSRGGVGERGVGGVDEEQRRQGARRELLAKWIEKEVEDSEGIPMGIGGNTG